MSSIRVRKRLATLLVVLCALLLAVDGGRVICFGADGHIGIESLGDGHRLERGSPTRAAVSLSEADIEHGPCVDASVLPSPVVQANDDTVCPPAASALDLMSAEGVGLRSEITAWSLESRWRTTSASLPAVGLSITVLRI